ncbi:uncharacterized protein BP01DRAFT_216981 [Aspergillus saccharolyticus JOP 1030-1]|uniref:SAP domain-containing protein n=1 Tax=Aspergillus saccharolyticus JOP 1030-1 TaxID=1450539 RepID=A0A318ZKU8_9EURO|nr:hypothetical protein BP01DRAFT_216981 [Aspergillus saccharolyticus JOP 1030-1]PYH47487.1 hypothetical protein BP01DRAFT_216981 [Aspergillus saccharolyticus JOP 1030-1]
MTAARSNSLRALRLLSQQQSVLPSVRRGLHITGVHSAQPANVSDRASLYSSRTVADLKNECQKRSLRSSGTQAELVERLQNHDFLQSRAFSIAMRRISGNSIAEYNHSRQFNTSRSMKAVGDSSTVDFAYMPSLAELDAPAARADPQFPIVPDFYSHHSSAQADSPMKPQIYTVSGGDADVSASPMTEVVDNHSVDIDPFSLTEAVGKSRSGADSTKQGSKEPGLFRELWTGVMDDILGRQPAVVRK